MGNQASPSELIRPAADGRGSADSHTLSYRPFIDGLRAIAVLSVVIYHLRRTLLPGGFLGVDIFFVLSGFLITGIIWREARLDSFTYARFYERRIRRIAPALLAMLVATTIVGTALLLPQDLISFAKSAIATVSFVANIWFWRDSDYFSAAADEKPLLHMWSLGVEEQFYIFFPMLLIFLTRYARRSVLPTILALCLSSFLFNILLVQIGGATPAFYLIPSRAWELGIGSIVAIFPSPTRLGSRFGNIAAALSLAVLVASILIDPRLIAGVLPNATAAVLATALMLWTRDTDSSTHRLLSIRPLTTIGLISYSLYLWHWPVIVFSQYWLVRPLDGVEALIAIAVMILLAATSWRWVERPFRSKAMRRLRLYQMVAGVAAFLLLAAAGLIASGGLPSRLPPDAARIDAVAGTLYRCPIIDTVHAGMSRGCAMNLSDGNVGNAGVALIGNSHALMYAPLVGSLLKARSIEGILLNANSCIPSASINLSPSCGARAQAYIDAVEKLPNAKTIIVAFDWGGASEHFVDRLGQPVEMGREDALIKAVDETIVRLRAKSKKVILIGPIAMPGWQVASVMSRQIAFGRPVTGPLDMPESQFMGTAGKIISHYQNRTDVIFVRPDLVQCNSNRCEFMHDGVPLFADNNHIAQIQLGWFASVFSRALDQAEGKKAGSRRLDLQKQ
jgi:peptidoglycan/LPS O-acetylase OafA/YrhL